ncbi:MAG: oxygen-independent coproporphyrinogen III oxidase [Betaproteobacteria bacterium]|nr:oxygen-independent coproporphyrinogen III oxidase [Betaproteobacteria bacterium]MCC7217523.1 oxygen-independent coproporphyrinogen III oxidase [Burkholderiales bacterium]
MPLPALAFDAGLVAKYDQFGPRYTSYPTADRFHDGFGPAQYVEALAQRNHERPDQPLSLYVHLPFCNTICYYCACNKVLTKDHGRSAKYIRYVEREIALVSALIEGAPPVVQLHWGGGTPTFLSRDEMKTLMDALRARFVFAPDAEVSIEVDPRKVEPDTIAYLGELGFNRLSVGIQDFDPEVQAAVNRIQSEAETRAVMDAARRSGFVSVNADLIYGLPRQTVEGFSATLDRVIDASPDRIALYSYAHVPHLFKPQRRIAIADLPPPQAKLAILALAIEKLTDAGYVYIGMDHFAKPGDELAVAQRERKLHRNFQGYSTKPDCDMLAFGISAIGKVGAAYTANVKTLDEYYARLDAQTLPVMRGVTLDADDLLRRDVIQKLMCNFDLDFGEVERAHGIRFAETFAPELAALAPPAADGLVEIDANAIRVTARGRLLVRTVAMTFDRYLRERRQGPQYSKVI